jgi:hypothetical protein
MTTDGGELALTARNASIEDLVALLRGQQARKVDVCDQGIADKLGIPAAYLKKMRTSRPALFDANVNGWLAGDERSFFVRCLRGGEILDHFIKGGDLTAGGIMHAVTSAAQVQDDGDAAWDMENTALEALQLAAAL